MEKHEMKHYFHVMINQQGTKISFDGNNPGLLGDVLFDFLDQIDTHPCFNILMKENRQPYEVLMQRLIGIQNRYRSYTQCLAENMTEQKMWLNDELLRYKCISGLNMVYESGEIWFDYLVTSFEDCLYIEFRELLVRQLRIKKCKNCGKYFVAKKSNVDYCHRVDSENQKTCAQAGYVKTFSESVKNDELLLAYTRAYKAHYARMATPRKKGGNMTREAFDMWHNQAKADLIKARQGEMPIEEFIKWLRK